MIEDEAIQRYLEQALNISNPESRWNVDHRDFRFDLFIRDKGSGQTYVIEIKQRASLESLAYLNLLRDHYRRRNGDRRCVFALASKSTSPRLREIAEEFEIRMIDLPLNLIGSPDTRGSSAATKITAPKTWNIVTALISKGASSIRSLAISEKVSYAWAHRVITSLIEQGAAGEAGAWVKITDVGKVLNGVAWERPLSGLAQKEIIVPNESVMSLARELTSTMDNGGQKIAFCGYLAGSLHTGAAMRHDMVQAYLPEAMHREVARMFRSNMQGSDGIRFQLLAPDRDVFTSSLLVEGVRITSRRQTLLDVAGLGYGGMEMANALVREHDRL